MGLDGFFTWIQEQGTILLYIAVIVVPLIFAFKRQWIQMAGSLVGLAVIAIFVTKPEIIKTMGTTIGGWIGIS